MFEHVARKAGLVTTAGPNVRFAEAGKLMGLAAYGGPQTNWMRWFQPVDGAPRVTVSAYDIFLEIAAMFIFICPGTHSDADQQGEKKF